MAKGTHRVVIVGGGNAGVSVAARLRGMRHIEVVVVEPSDDHYYQPLWTLVGGGLVAADTTRRRTRDVIPKGVVWIQGAANAVDPDQRIMALADGTEVPYDYLVMCTGVQLDWQRIDRLTDVLGRDGVSSVYRVDLAERTWEFIENMRSGTAVFTQPSGPVKCPGAAQKIAYLAADYWRQEGVLDQIRIILVLPGEKLFGLPEFCEQLERVVERYGIDVRYEHEVVALDPDRREVVVEDRRGGTMVLEHIPYDFAHVVPPQSAPDWVKRSPIASDPISGFVDVDQHTLQHVRYGEVFAVGDVAGTPNAKTGAAVRKQVPIVVENILAAIENEALSGTYGGYASCPLVTSRNRVMLAEFNYDGEHVPSIPLINMARERYDMWLLKRYGLPWLYWNFILKGRM